MSLLAKDHGSLSLLRPSPPRLGRVLRIGWPLVLSLAVLWGTHSASGMEPAKGAKSVKGATQKEPLKDTPKAAPSTASTAQTQPAKTAEPQGGSCGATTEGPPAAKGATGAKWACAEPNLTLQPVWRGQEIECAWMIRNEGTGNLEINAKGG